jgi:hypothetical protein
MKSLKARATQMLAWPLASGGSADKQTSNDAAIPNRVTQSEQEITQSTSTKDSVPIPSQRAGTTLSKTSKKTSRPSRRRLTTRHDRRILLMALAAGFPAVLVALILLWDGAFPARLQWTLTVVILGFWFGFSHAVRERVVFPLQTLSNLLAALREGDFSIRARGAARDDALGEAMLEVNFLGQILREQRLGALEATALLRTVMAEIEVAIFALMAIKSQGWSIGPVSDCWLNRREINGQERRRSQP